jgi:hypothetical protein
MTLIITELSQFGIAMVADSAVTFSEKLPPKKTVHYVLSGARKLQAVPYLSAGVSMWGLGSIPIADAEVSTDVWLGDFIERHSAINSLNDFAAVLARELQDHLKHIRQPLGFHLAGYVEVGNKRLPTFYHVRNVDGTFKHYEHHEFIPGQDVPPREFSQGEAYITRNGDYGPYVLLAEVVRNALPQIEAVAGLTIPYPSLEGRIAYHSAWVKFVSELYASSGLLRTIGGSILSLGVHPDGQIVYYSEA